MDQFRWWESNQWVYMRISTDRGMVRLDLCVDYNGGMVSVCSTERCRGRGPGLWIRRDAESWGWVGPNLWTRWGAERLGWVCVLLQGWGERLGGWGGGWGCPWLRGDGDRMWVSISESTQTRTVMSWRLSSHITSPKVIHYITNPIIIM